MIVRVGIARLDSTVSRAQQLDELTGVQAAVSPFAGEVRFVPDFVRVNMSPIAAGQGLHEVGQVRQIVRGAVIATTERPSRRSHDADQEL